MSYGLCANPLLRIGAMLTGVVLSSMYVNCMCLCFQS
jgi:hypothetical protein